MGRHRAPETDFICRRCGCACDPSWAATPQHVGGGPGMKSCGQAPDPMLRSAVLDEAGDVIRYIRDRQDPL